MAHEIGHLLRGVKLPLTKSNHVGILAYLGRFRPKHYPKHYPTQSESTFPQTLTSVQVVADPH